jgi:hypothetical protein
MPEIFLQTPEEFGAMALNTWLDSAAREAYRKSADLT